MGIIGLTSVPCITPKMNWREWQLLQSWTGWLSLAFATAHVMVLGVPWWNQAKTIWPVGIPTITLVATAPPMAILAVKILMMVPPLPQYLAKVRAGAYKAPDVHAVFCREHYD